eukprot:maker-scaffold508_size152036-snap-gene-0.20 protein:Tk11408 transcript:maker-scaffold508_size152036-snap-gene-0.20-mRNA-1 annotation:"---NA---"
MDTLPPGPQTTSKELDLRTTDFPEAQDWPNRSEDTLNLICVPLIAGEPNPEFRYMPQGVVWECPGFLPYSSRQQGQGSFDWRKLGICRQKRPIFQNDGTKSGLATTDHQEAGFPAREPSHQSGASPFIR